MRYLLCVLGQTGRNLRQAWGTQLMSLLTVSLSVLLFAFFFLLYTNMVKAGQHLGDEVRLVVSLKEEIPPLLRPQIEKKIRTFGEVEQVVFVTRAEAFDRLRRQLGDQQEVLADLDPGFLPPSIEIVPRKNFRGLARVGEFSRFLETLPGATKVQYGREWLSRFGQFVSLLRLIVLLTGSLLIFTMVFVVFYTIRLTVDSRREELEVLRLLGASKFYFRLPLLLEGLILGGCGALFGLGGLYALYHWAGSQFGLVALLRAFRLSFFSIDQAGAILLAALLLCAGSSLIAIRKVGRI